MRFNNIFALFFLTKIFAYSIPSHLVRREELNESDIGMIEVCDQNENCQTLYEDPTNQKNIECSVAIYTECNVTTFYNKNTIDEICMNYNVDRCNTLLSKGFGSIASCANKDQRYLQELKNQIEEAHADLQIFCSKDAGGNLCPYTAMTLTEFPDYVIDINVITSENLAMESCKAKGCAETLPKIVEWASKKDVESGLNYNNIMKQLNDFIKSQKCTSVAQVKPFAGGVGNQNGGAANNAAANNAAANGTAANGNTNANGNANGTKQKSNAIIGNNTNSTAGNDSIIKDEKSGTTSSYINSVFLVTLFLLYALF